MPEAVVLSRVGFGDAHTLDRFVATGGYAALRTVVMSMAPDDVRGQVRRSGLTGRSGGAAFPTAASGPRCRGTRRRIW